MVDIDFVPIGFKILGLVIISPISPGVETPGYFLPSLRDCESPVRATDNSPAIHCRVGEVRTKPKIFIGSNHMESLT